MLSPGRGSSGAGGAGRVGGGLLRSCGGPSLARLPRLCSRAGGRATCPSLSVGPCLCLLCLCSVISGFMSHSSAGLWPHLTVQSADLLLVGCGQEEAAHLPLQRLLYLHVNVIARRLLLVRRVHTAGKARPWCSPAPRRPRAWGRCSGGGGHLERGGSGRTGRNDSLVWGASWGLT